jgi:uncharacterized membrane protein/pimeloyl-ACP methyl ester carboxylesterase
MLNPEPPSEGSVSPSPSVKAILARFVILILVVSGVGWQSALAQSYSLKTVDFPGDAFTFVYGINNPGQVVGGYNTQLSGGHDHGYLLSGSQMTTIDYPGATDTDLSGINDSGQIVGEYLVDGSGVGSKGFLLSGGQFTVISYPNAQFTSPVAINNAGQVVGYYLPAGAGGYIQGFIFSGGSFLSVPPPPGGGPFYFNGINNAGQIVGNTNSSAFLLSSGSYSFLNFGTSSIANGVNDAGLITGSFRDNNNVKHAFVLSGGPGGKLITLDSLGVASLSPSALNNAGQIVGFYDRPGGGTLGFIASTVTLVDPVDVDPSNSLLNGSAVTTDASLLAAKGRPVRGLAADGVAQVVIRIPATNVGDQFTLTLFGDQQPLSQSSLPNEDGALGNVGDTTFSQSQLTVNAQSTGSGPNGPNAPFAFAIYRAPVDFARPTGLTYKSGGCVGATLTDDQSGCRTVSIVVQDRASGTSSSVPILIVRPLVALIHGLWADSTSWSNFAPFNVSISSDGRFSSGTVGYDTPVAIASSSPSFDPSMFPKLLGNSMGFQYNAPEVAAQIDILLQNFKIGQNPQAIPVAAVQGDVITHSMGGTITRTIALQTDYLSPSNFGQGVVHKVITIDTPHLGSPLATQLLSGQNDCTLSIFAKAGMFSLSSVVLKNGFTFAGGVGDLQGDGVGGGMSAGLADLANPQLAQHPLPTALIAGTMTSSNLSGLTGSVLANTLRNICLPFSDPLAVNLTTSGWPNVFSGQPSDGIVPLNSQLNRVNGNPTTTVPPGSLFTSPGYIHTRALTYLGFSGPTVLDAGAVPAQVVNLLNTPVTDPVFNLLNP